MRLALTVIFVGLCLGPAFPQAAPSGAPRAVEHVRGPIRESVAQIMSRDVQARARLLETPRVSHRKPRAALSRRARDAASPAPDLAVPLQPGVVIGPKSPQAEGSTFLGTQSSETPGLIPLDAMGAVGPTQIVVISNGLVKVLDKATGSDPGILNTSVDNFFASVITAGTFPTDVRARFDVLSQRWFLAALDGDTTSGLQTGNQWMLAVSSDATIRSTAGYWTFYSFTAGINGWGADSDSVGIDANALYVGVNLFDSSGNFQGSAGFVVQKSSVLTAGTLHATAFPGLCDISGNGTFMPQGVDNDDPSATVGFLIGVDVSSLNSGVLSTTLRMIRFAGPGGLTPTIDATLAIAVPPFGNSLGGDRILLNLPASGLLFPIGVPVKGCDASPGPDPPAGVVDGLDDLDQRLTVATIKAGNLWTVHNIDVDLSGAAITLNPATGIPTSNQGRDGARWYEIGGIVSNSPSLLQSGTLFDTTAGTMASSYFVPSLAVTGQGHMAVASTRGGPNEFAQIAAAGRLSGDSLGSLQGASLLQASGSAYNADPSDPAQRWGDYSYTCVDPTDNMTVWTFQEFCNAPNSMEVRVIQLLAPPPATPTTPFPSTLSTGLSSILVTVTGVSSAGSAYYDPGPGYPRHLSASVSGGVTVNQATYLGPTEVLLDLNTTGAAAGPVTVQVTNPDGQSSSGANILTIAAPSATPATVTAVTSSVANGTYGEGAAIPITVAFSEAVTVSGGTPTLSLSSGGVASYASGTGTANLIFNYTVAPGDSTGASRLDVSSGTALSANGATIQTLGAAASLTLPVGATPSPPWSLATLKSIFINTTPPVTAITGHPLNPSNNTQPTFSFSANQAGCTFQVQLDGGAWIPIGGATSYQTAPLADGSHTFSVRATDPLGNVDPSPPSFTWTVDTVPPVTSFVTTPPNPDTNPSPTFSYSANKPNCDFETSLDGGAWSTASAATSKVIPLAVPGSHTLLVRAVDSAGNIDPAPPSYTWTANFTPPPPASSGGGGGHGGCGAVGPEGFIPFLLLMAGRVALHRRARGARGLRSG